MPLKLKVEKMWIVFEDLKLEIVILRVYILHSLYFSQGSELQLNRTEKLLLLYGDFNF